ncbi:DnaJ C-terminal domain-containing protein [Rhizobium sp. PAMB 3182]
MRDPYAVLGVDSNASEKEIKSAWRSAAKAFHPDRNRDNPDAASQFAEVGKAYDMLKNPAKRDLLDQARGAVQGKDGEPTFMQKREEARAAAKREAERQAREAEALAEMARQANASARAAQSETAAKPGATSGASPSSPKAGTAGKADNQSGKPSDAASPDFEEQPEGGLETAKASASANRLKLQAAELLVSFYRRITGYRPPPEQAPDYHLDKEVTIGELLSGRWTTVTTPDERDVGFYLTPGMTEGYVVELKGHGSRLTGMRNGDLFVTLRVARDIAFSVEGHDIRTVLPISLEDAVLGLQTEVEGPQGSIPVTVEPWSGSEKTIRISGHGLKTEDDGRGDLIVELRIFLGEKPDEKVTDLMRIMRQGLYL